MIFTEKFNSKVKQEGHILYLTSSSESSRASTCGTRGCWLTVYKLAAVTGVCALGRLDTQLGGHHEGESNAVIFVIMAICTG